MKTGRHDHVSFQPCAQHAEEFEVLLVDLEPEICELLGRMAPGGAPHSVRSNMHCTCVPSLSLWGKTHSWLGKMWPNNRASLGAEKLVSGFLNPIPPLKKNIGNKPLSLIIWGCTTCIIFGGADREGVARGIQGGNIHVWYKWLAMKHFQKINQPWKQTRGTCLAHDIWHSIACSIRLQTIV